MFQTDWLSVCVTHQPFEYNDPKERGRITSIKMKLNESNKEINYKKKTEKKTKQKNTNLHGLELRTFWL